KVPTISPAVEQVVLTALAKDPKERFGSVRAFANAFVQAAGAPELLSTFFTRAILPRAPAGQPVTPVSSLGQATISSPPTHITPHMTPHLSHPFSPDATVAVALAGKPRTLLPSEQPFAVRAALPAGGSHMVKAESYSSPTVDARYVKKQAVNWQVNQDLS